MIYKNVSDVIKFVTDEITERRKRDISFFATSAKLIAFDFLRQLIEYKPSLLLCIKDVDYQIRNLGVILEYKITVGYTNVMPSCVSYITDKKFFKEVSLSCAMLHRRELFVVFKNELCNELLSTLRDFNKDPRLLSCFLQGTRCEIKRISGCTYCGLKVMLNYTCSYKEYRLRISEINRTAVDIIDEAKKSGIEDWKRAYAVVQYCVKNWEYGRFVDSLGMEFTAYGAIVQHKAVCMGISLAICMLFKELGIPCRYIQGIRDGEGHAWNMVFIMGGWFYIDVTDAIGAQDPLYHWGMTSFDDRRSIEFMQVVDLKCNCPPNYIRTYLRRRR